MKMLVYLKTITCERTYFVISRSNKAYALFTDAGKYVCNCVLTQSFENERGGKNVVIQHTITFEMNYLNKTIYIGLHLSKILILCTHQ